MFVIMPTNAHISSTKLILLVSSLKMVWEHRNMSEQF